MTEGVTSIEPVSELSGRRGIPGWAWLLILMLAATQPFVLFWIRHSPPPDTVATGLHIPDSALFLQAMRMFENGFESPYATCKSAHGIRGIEFYAVPHLWLYGALGWLARLVHGDDYAAYAVANGIGAFVYLLAACWFLREAVPRQADLAFLLFALSGGLGGILYAATGALGLHHVPAFEEIFRRYAVYELFEGPHLLPVLLMPRFYYTLSLGLCLAAVTAYMKCLRTGGWRWFALMLLLFAPGAFIDLRYGIFTFGLIVLYTLAQTQHRLETRLALCTLAAAPLALGGIPASLLMRLNPAVIQNHLHVTNMAMWLSPFISVAIFHLLLLPGELRVRFTHLTQPFRIVAAAALGYLLTFAGFFCIYQVYFGNILVARDAAVANAISDWALLGAVAGAFYAWNRPAPSESRRPDWIVLWLLVYLALAISAFGGGHFLRYGPQRIEVLLWLPLCMLSAAALQRHRVREPHATFTLAGIMIGCGAASIMISTLCFQAPLDYEPHRSPYAALHAEVMTQADAAVMDRIGAGIVLAPMPASDVIVRRRGNRTVFGAGSFNLSDQPYVPLETQVNRFFSTSASDDERADFVAEWCVEYIYCPDTWPVAPEVLEVLRRTPWLEEIASEDQAALFRVMTGNIVVAATNPVAHVLIR
jgi:hypothetical protein